LALFKPNRGKITSTNSTHPTSQIAKQIPAQRNTRNKRPIAKRFSARAQITSYRASDEGPVQEFFALIIAPIE
jgi:hypothetical protein